MNNTECQCQYSCKLWYSSNFAYQQQKFKDLYTWYFYLQCFLHTIKSCI